MGNQLQKGYRWSRACATITEHISIESRRVYGKGYSKFVAYASIIVLWVARGRTPLGLGARYTRETHARGVGRYGGVGMRKS